MTYLTRPSKATLGLLVAFSATVAIEACERQPSAPPAASIQSDPLGGFEGEFFGNIWENGHKTKDPSFMVVLRPANAPTAARLRFYRDSMWADTTGSAWMYEWSDPKGGGNCGDLTTFLASDTLKPAGHGGRYPESHRVSPNVAPVGVEKHCLRPGTYEFIVKENGLIIKDVFVDYLALVPADTEGLSPKLIWNAIAQENEAVEALDYNDSFNVFQDLVVHVDLNSVGNSETRVLDIQNTLASPVKDTFVDQTSPAGSDLDYFRTSSARSSSTWALYSQGKALSRLYWDYGRNFFQRTGFFDANNPIGRPLLRVHTFSHVTVNGPDTVALEMMRPDEQPDSTAVTKRVVQITRVTPCFEGAATWQITDQYLNAACLARGSQYRYRWQVDAGGPWTSFVSDTIYDFPGHSVTGTHQVTVEVQNTSNGQTTPYVRNIVVQTGQILLSGPTDVTDKQSKLYTSSLSAQWFERYDPALQWFPATDGPQPSMTRIWPGGDYEVELRQQDSTATLVKRGRLHIIVCNVAGCGTAPVSQLAATTSAEDPHWSIFGGGPWLSWGSTSNRQSLRFYDLLGMHDGSTAFTNAAWIDGGSGSITGQFTWQPRDLGLASARAFDFVTTRGGGTPAYVFGFAIDPDLGGSPVDDASGYDAGRGMLYITDTDRAIGILLRDATGNTLSSVQQFGVGRWAPTTAWTAWQAQRQSGVHLVAGQRDVQFVLSATEVTGSHTYTFVLIRGPNLAALQQTADAAIVILGGP